MPVSVRSFGGKLGFLLRIYLPKLSFFLFSYSQRLLTRKFLLSYMERCLPSSESASRLPDFISIETINRCNGKCPFCPANLKNEQRPYKKMDDKLFEKIIDELQLINYAGVLCLYINNEPFMDKRMPDMLKTVRTRLPHCTILMFTNGSLLNKVILDDIADCVDIMFINNYNDRYELTEQSKMAFEHIKNNESKFSKMKVVIQRRYANEFLTNRAGTAPNKPSTDKLVKFPCVMPFSDLTIFPDGTVGLCCNDALEKTSFGNINNQSLLDVFHGDSLRELRKKMYTGRDNVEFCKHCDYIDGGFRVNYLKKTLGATKSNS